MCDVVFYFQNRGNDPARLAFEMQSPIAGLERVGKNIVVGCMDQTVTCLTTKVSERKFYMDPRLLTIWKVLSSCSSFPLIAFLPMVCIVTSLELPLEKI